MKKLFLVVPLAALALGGCSVAAFMQNARDVGQEAREVLAKIKAGAKVAAAVTDRSITFICGKLPQVNVGLRQVAAAWPSPGPNTAKWLAIAEDDLDRATVACANYTGNGNPAVLIKLAQAFDAGAAAVMAADAAGGK